MGPSLSCCSFYCCCCAQPNLNQDNGEGIMPWLTGAAEPLARRRRHGRQRLGPGRKVSSCCTWLIGWKFWVWDGVRRLLLLFRCTQDLEDLALDLDMDGWGESTEHASLELPDLSLSGESPFNFDFFFSEPPFLVFQSHLKLQLSHRFSIPSIPCILIFINSQVLQTLRNCESAVHLWGFFQTESYRWRRNERERDNL